MGQLVPLDDVPDLLAASTNVLGGEVPATDLPEDIYGTDSIPLPPPVGSSSLRTTALLKQTGMELASLADIVLSVPSMVVQTTATIGSALGLAAAGAGSKETWEEARKIGLDRGEFLANPVQKALAAVGVVPDETPVVERVMATVGETVEAATQAAESGAVPKEALLTMFDVAMAGMGAKGYNMTGAALAKKISDTNKIKQTNISPESVRAVLDEAAAKDAPPSPNAVKAAMATNFKDTVAAADATRNATQRAYDLVLHGASLRQVEGIRKASPAVGAALDKIMETRMYYREAMKELPDATRDSLPILNEPLVGSAATMAWARDVDAAFTQIESARKFAVESDVARAYEKAANVQQARLERDYTKALASRDAERAVLIDQQIKEGLDKEKQFTSMMHAFQQSLIPEWQRRAPRPSITDYLTPEIISKGPSAILPEAFARAERAVDEHLSRAYASHGLDHAVRILQKQGAAAKLRRTVWRSLAVEEISTGPVHGELGGPRGLPGAGELTSSGWVARQEAKHRRQTGKVDPKLVAVMGAAGIGGLLGMEFAQDSKLRGAFLGALAGVSLPYMRDAAKMLAPHLDNGLGLASTRLGNVSPRLGHFFREHERAIMSNLAARTTAANAFFKDAAKLKDDLSNELDHAIISNDPSKIKETLVKIGNPNLAKALLGIRKMLDETGDQLLKYGLIAGKRENYFPRMVKDLEGLKAALGAEYSQGVEDAIRTASKKAEAAGRGKLTDTEISGVINSYLTRTIDRRKPGYAHARVLDSVEPELAQYYHQPADALYKYIVTTTEAIEKAKLFGKNLVKETDGAQITVALDESIGNLIRDLKLAPDKVDEVRDIIKARFTYQGSMNEILQTAKDISHAGILANYVSATTQLADVLTVQYMNGVGATAKAVAKVLTGKTKIDLDTTGISHKISEEISTTRGTAKFLHKMFELSGFAAIDRFGKKVAMQSTLDKYQKLSKTDTGRAAIQKEYGEVYGPDLSELLNDLKQGKKSDIVDSLLFSKLSDIQPISRMEMPVAYLNHPNGRVVYMLKSFTLKQLDIARRDGYNELRKGNYRKGVTNLVSLGTTLGIAGATTQQIHNFILGVPVDPKLGDLGMNLLKTFGWTNHVTEQINRGRPVQAAVSIAAPPYSLLDSVLAADPKAVQYIPLVGKVFYFRLMGGAEERAKRQQQEQQQSDSIRMSDIKGSFKQNSDLSRKLQ